MTRSSRARAERALGRSPPLMRTLGAQRARPRLHVALALTETERGRSGERRGEGATHGTHVRGRSEERQEERALRGEARRERRLELVAHFSQSSTLMGQPFAFMELGAGER